MVCIRGVNVYPSAIEAVVRTAREVVEYRASVQTDSALGSLSVEIEVEATEPDPRTVARRVANKLKEALGLTVSVAVVGPGELPRFEMKARRFILQETVP